MPTITIIYGALLALIGLLGYFATGRESVTALIPLFFGIPVIVLGVLARAKPDLRKHVMHGAAGLALLGVLGTARALAKLPALVSGQPLERPAAVLAQNAMAILSLVFLALCVKSFVDARRAPKP